jgi:hypothetical protein
MRRFLILIGCVIAVCAVAAQTATAATTVSISMTFAEPTIPGLVRGCPISPMDGLCGSGEVIPFGHATDTVEFGAGISGPSICSDGCDLRTINLPQGAIVSDELFTNPACPGNCVGPHKPQFGTLTDVIISGTGRFTGATGGAARPAQTWCAESVATRSPNT